jgi:hypothetical protein
MTQDGIGGGALPPPASAGPRRSGSRRSVPMTGPRNARLRRVLRPDGWSPGCMPVRMSSGTAVATARKTLGAVPWLPTSRAPPPTRFCTGWSTSTWKPASPRPPRAPTGWAAPLHRTRVPRLPPVCVLAHGFLRVQCDECAFERLVPLSCKGRAVCASWGGRRMAEQAANLVAAVLPWVPLRQWVFTIPHRRYPLALTTRCVGPSSGSSYGPCWAGPEARECGWWRRAGRPRHRSVAGPGGTAACRRRLR